MTTSRIQLALNVDDIDVATDFYTKLFGVAPHKQRPGYANFVVADPPLKLVLFENPQAPQRLNHLGIETTTVDHIPAAHARFRAAGLQTTLAMSDHCCHAVQDKILVTAPDAPNGWWEYYAIVENTPADPSQDPAAAPVCCAIQRDGNNPESCCS